MKKHFKENLRMLLVSIIMIFGSLVVFHFTVHDGIQRITLQIATLALLYPILKAMQTDKQNNKVRKIEIVEGHSLKSLEKEVNKRLKELKGNTIISVEIRENTKAVILYY